MSEEQRNDEQRRAALSGTEGYRAESDDGLEAIELYEGLINPKEGGGRGGAGGGGPMMMPPMMGGARGAGMGGGAAGAGGAAGMGAAGAMGGSAAMGHVGGMGGAGTAGAAAARGLGSSSFGGGGAGLGSSFGRGTYAAGSDLSGGIDTDGDGIADYFPGRSTAGTFGTGSFTPYTRSGAGSGVDFSSRGTKFNYDSSNRPSYEHDFGSGPQFNPSMRTPNDFSVNGPGSNFTARSPQGGFDSDFAKTNFNDFKVPQGSGSQFNAKSPDFKAPNAGTSAAGMGTDKFGKPIDADGDGKIDGWDTDGDGKIDAWDTNGDGLPDKFDSPKFGAGAGDFTSPDFGSPNFGAGAGGGFGGGGAGGFGGGGAGGFGGGGAGGGGGSFQVDTDEVTGTAKGWDQLAAEVAALSSRASALSPDFYYINTPKRGYQKVGNLVASLTTEAGQTFTDIATKLNETANGYAEVENKHASMSDGVEV